MFHFLKKSQGSSVIFKIKGMHCVSCSMNIDDELENTEGVFRAQTNFAAGKTVIEYDSTKVSPQKLKAVIESLKYSAQQL